MQQKGFIFVFVMLIVILIAIIAGVLNAISISNHSISRNDLLSQRTYYAAEAGIEYGVYLVNKQIADGKDPSVINDWPDLDGNPATTGDIPRLDLCTPYNLALDIKPKGADYDIVSESTVSNRTRRITVTISPQGKLVSWQ